MLKYTTQSKIRTEYFCSRMNNYYMNSYNLYNGYSE